MFILALSFLFSCMIFVETLEVDKGGWTPISRDDVQSIQILRDNAITVVAPDKVAQFNFLPEVTAFKTFRKTSDCKPGACQSNKVESNETNILLKNVEIIKNIYAYKNIRKPKAITAGTVEVNNLRDAQENTPNLLNKSSYSKANLLEDEKNEDSQPESQNHYEVSEEDEEHFIGEQEQLNRIKNSESKFEYSYRIPDHRTNNISNSNLTSSFLSILSQYDIKPQDYSANYVLSRNKNIEIQKKVTLIPISEKIHKRYNSLNHLPVNPLIAVFLSNYGHYLPRYYGLQNNYKNLYGYLASNNIHNNLPFGLYKVFSDTDSSN